MTQLILATTSLHRRKAFGSLGFNYTAESSNVNEYFAGRPDNPQELVKKSAELKAKAIAPNYANAIIMGFDSVGFLGNTILEKPKSKQEAFEKLRSLSGKDHQYYTGIHMINTANEQELSRVVKTDISMRELNDSEIEKYLNEDEGYKNLALGYNTLKHTSLSFIKRIEGSYHNILWGLPLETIVEMLPEIGYEK